MKIIKSLIYFLFKPYEYTYQAPIFGSWLNVSAEEAAEITLVPEQELTLEVEDAEEDLSAIIDLEITDPNDTGIPSPPPSVAKAGEECSPVSDTSFSKLEAKPSLLPTSEDWHYHSNSQ